MAEHTPGPWEVDDCGNICGQGAALAQVFGAEDFPCIPEEDYDDVNLECAANARLIAAAPDLLAACQSWVSYFDQLQRLCEPGDPLNVARQQFHGERVNRTRAAIAKAAGKEV